MCWICCWAAPHDTWHACIVAGWLQDAASLGGAGAEHAVHSGAALSDADSEAGCDLTVASRFTAGTAGTASSELLAATAGLGGRAVAAAAAAGVAASPPPPASAAGAAGPGGSRLLTLVGAHQCITSIVALQSRLRDLAGRSQALQEQLQQRLGPRQQQQAQQHSLAALAQDTARCRQQAAEAQRELAEVQAAAGAAKKLTTVRSQALVTTLKVMQAADRRIGCAAFRR